MKNELDDLLNAVFGPRRTISTPKKEAGPGRQSDGDLTLEQQMSLAKQRAFYRQMNRQQAYAKTHTAEEETLDAIQRAVRDNQRTLDETAKQQARDIAEMNRSAMEDIERIQRELQSPAVKNLAAGTTKSAPEPMKAGRGADGFNGLGDELAKRVFGQEAFLRSLVIAFKRPYVMGHQGEAARNAMLVCGAPRTGRHLALGEAVLLLKERGVFTDGSIAWVDLALYPTPAQETLFLQDLYGALASDAEVVAFEHYESCHIGFLTVLSELVADGKSPLKSRYVLQNGRLVDAGGALVANAVSALTPRGKYLVFISEQGAQALSGRFGRPFVQALGDVCETQPLDAAALQKIADTQAAELAERARKSLSFELKGLDGLAKNAVAACGKTGSASALLDAFDGAYRALAQYKLEHDCPAPLDVVFLADGRVKLGGETVELASLLPRGAQDDLAAVRAELEGLIGLEDVKRYVLGLEDNLRMQRRRRAEGLAVTDVSMHMIFTGNPGTGKTTVARLVSRYLKALGALSGGQLVEVTRADLVGRYVGHTAPLTTQVLKSAVGGVLFIDEAYSLYRGKQDSFGLEAIDTLVKGMEDYRDDLVVILAGYTREMEEFLTANSGLKSRFPNIIEFADYTADELLSILQMQAKSRGYRVDARCVQPLRAYFGAVQSMNARDAGNGRLARNKLEEAILAQARRAASDEAADLSLLLPEDFDLTLPA